MDIKNQTTYFNERIKPYHVKTRNVATVATVQEATLVNVNEHLVVTETTYPHDVVLIDTTIGYDSGSYDGTYDSIIFKKNAPYVSVYVDNILLNVSDWDDGFWNGSSFNNGPSNHICNAIQLSAPYGTTKDVWVIGVYTTTFNLAINQRIQLLWFNDGSNPSSDVWYNKNSNAIDLQVSTGEHIRFVEGYYNGTTFEPDPLDGICNAVELLYPIYNDEAEITLTLRNKFAVKYTLIAGNTLITFTGDVKLAFDGTDDSIIFKKNAPYVSIYADNILLNTIDWDDGFWNGFIFNNNPINGICNAIQLTSPYGITKDIRIIGLYTTTFNLAINQSIQLLRFNDGSNPSSDILYNKNSNTIDVQVSTGEHIQFVEGYYNGTSFESNPLDGICNAVELLYPISNDEIAITVTLRTQFEVKQTLIAGKLLITFTGDVKLAYDWPNTNSPGPNDFFFSTIVVNDGTPSSVTEILNLP